LWSTIIGSQFAVNDHVVSSGFTHSVTGVAGSDVIPAARAEPGGSTASTTSAATITRSRTISRILNHQCLSSGVLSSENLLRSLTLSFLHTSLDTDERRHR